jgi:hypothetical protein
MTMAACSAVLPGYSYDTAYSPIRDCLGGFHESIPLHGRREGSALIVVGEVSGGGRQTSAAVSDLVRTIRELAVDFSGPGALLAELNTRINTRVNSRIGDARIGGRLSGETATCLAFFLEPDGNCTVASAGRPWPIVNGREVTSKKGLPLGLLNKTEFPEKRLILCDYAVSAKVQIDIPCAGVF